MKLTLLIGCAVMLIVGCGWAGVYCERQIDRWEWQLNVRPTLENSPLPTNEEWATARRMKEHWNSLMDANIAFALSVSAILIIWAYRIWEHRDHHRA